MISVKNYNKIRKKDDLVLAYLNDIKGSKSKPISPEEEKELLAKYYADGTTEAEKTDIKKKIVMSHQRFLYDMANCYSNGDNNMLLELINVGTIGMYETFDNFDITKDNKFMTYAQYYVRRAIKHFLDDENLVVRPANNAKITPKVKKIEEEFYRTQGRKPNIFEVEDILFEKYGIELADRNDIYGATIERIEDTTDGSEDDSYTFERSKDFTDYASTENEYEVEAIKNDTAYEVAKAISRLPERESKIIKMAYGIGDYNKPCNNIEIGEALGLTSERVRQLKKSAEEKLKSMFEKSKMFIFIILMVLIISVSSCSCGCNGNNNTENSITLEPQVTVYELSDDKGYKTKLKIFKYELPEGTLIRYKLNGETKNLEFIPTTKPEENVLKENSYFDF